MEFTQVFPARGQIDVDRYLTELALADKAPANRPFVLVNFVASVDGRATVDGVSGGLGDDGDKALFGALRRHSDVVMAGTGTLRAERYGRILRTPESRKWRAQRGMRPEPLAFTLTRRGSIPLDIPLFAEPEAHVVVFSGADIDTSGVRAQLEVVVLEPEELTFAAAFEYLRSEHGVRTVACEGGPRVFSQLAGEHVVDQLFLTIAPKLVGGGTAPTITLGEALPEPSEMTLEAVLERHGTLFLRYGLI